MGFFSKFAAAVSGIASKAAKKVKQAAAVLADAASDAIDWAKNKLGRTTYNSRSVESRVNVENTLSDFKRMIEKKAGKVEKTCADSAMEHFDAFAEDLEEHFPELVALVRTRQEEAREMLSDTIIDYVHQRVSENDADFQAVLEMAPGEEKEEALKRCMNRILRSARKEFSKKVKRQLRLLNDELNVRLEQKLKSEEETLGAIAEKYESLERQAANETLDLRQLEEECEPVIEAAACIGRLLDEEKGA